MPNGSTQNGRKEVMDPYGKPQDWFSHIVIVRSDVKREYFPTFDAYDSELECVSRADAIKEEIEKLGIKATIIVADDQLTENLLLTHPDLCINFTDSIRGNMSACAGVPTIFDLLGIPYVGANTLCLSLNCNKFLTKTILEAWDIPTPQYQLMRDPKQPLDYHLRFPLICKLNEEHGGVGISERSVVTNEKEFRTHLSWLMNTYHQAVLVEEFIEGGEELTALALEKERLKVYLCKRVFHSIPGDFQILTYYAPDPYDPLSKPADPDITHEKYTDHSGRIRADVRQAFEVLRLDDYARFDIMLDKYGNHFIVDVNSNPSLGPNEPVAEVARVNGRSFQEVLITILRRNMLDRLEEPSVGS